ncbi:MAG: hypothetical protein JW731_08420 [Bacteroidales bacterium]|nr:hypothetical protein [Bacteroidales bacterium]
MKKNISVFIIFLIGIIPTAITQSLINNGADIKITSGSYLVIDGDFINQLDGSVDNSGTIMINGDWTNNQSSGALLNGTTGEVVFNGSTVQAIQGSHVTYFYDLILQNDVSLGANTSVHHELSLSNTYMGLGNYELLMQFGSTITGASSSGYIIASGSGHLKQNVGAGDKTFPVGTVSAFVPLTLNNTGGTADYYSARVFPDVRVNGTTGATIPEINDCVDMTWVIEEDVPGGSNLAVTPYWTAGLEGPNFDRTHAGIGHYTGGAWDPQEEIAASGSNPYNITRTGITTLSAFAVGDLESPMAIPVDIRLDVATLLEGPFNGSTMNTDLKTAGLIPLNQPYNTPPWNYAGSESVGAIPPNVEDWILIELRDATSAANATPATIIARKAAFILNDGSVVNLDGSTLPAFSTSVSNQLFVVVWHRNHLGIMSATGLTKIGGIYSYDFTSGLGQAYLNGQKNLGGGNYGMFGGNASKNGVVDAADYTVWRNQASTSGYKLGDHSMDGQVDNNDKNDTWVENLGITSKVPN